MGLKNYDLLSRTRSFMQTFSKTLGRRTPMETVKVKYEERDAKTLWKFRSEDDIEKYWFTQDDNMSGGRSLIELAATKGGRLHMKGKIDATPSYYVKGSRPWDGSGYAGIRSYPFKVVWDDIQVKETTQSLNPWHQFEFRVRGDGRRYRIQLWFMLSNPDQLSIKDQTRFWVGHMQTRGGPYWERIKIPFNRFYPIKDEQVQRLLHHPPVHKLYNMGIFCDNQLEGDFSLEIDSIRVLDTYVDEDYKPSPDTIYQYQAPKVVLTDEELLGKYRPSRVYSKHDHILY